jgi:ADP-ribose pyrophosphatase YjhB (NUDIX family)
MSEIRPRAADYFKFCPSCGAPGPEFLDGKRWLCRSCGFEYFHNVAAAAGVILERAGVIVFLERAKDPRKGKLGLPGGFIDPGERAEDAVMRECAEEIGWAPPSISFLGSFPNSYRYGGVAYNTCDLYFYYRFAEGAEPPRLSPGDGEAIAVRLVALADLREEDLAFPSLVRAIEAYRAVARGRLDEGRATKAAGSA